MALRLSRIRRALEGFSFVGLAVATLFFAASLTPSLLPRHFAVQGVLSGVALATGYGVGVLIVALWFYVELRAPRRELQRFGKRVTAVAVLVVAAAYLVRATVWQNSIRQRMEMPPLETAYPWRVALIALAVSLPLIFIARGLRACWRWVDRQTNRVTPRRVSYVVSTTLVALGAVIITNDVLVRMALDAADRVFSRLDRMVDDGVEQPMSLLACGSPASRVAWDDVGRYGKQFLAAGPTQSQIESFWGDASATPLRVYVGLESRSTPQQRAQLALEELIRVGGFDRPLLLIATPTGTGWLDPGAVDTIEYLHAGNTALVSLQYSYLPSWLTILVDPHRSRDAAQALFDEVYGHWKELPKDRRPRLFVHGLSLGALGSAASADLFTIFEDPIQGAVWSGPPFPSTVWNKAVQGRNSDSPMWLPRFRDGSMLRFTGRENSLPEAGDHWGPMRCVYIQHASDPMCFFSPDLLFRKPAWLTGARGPDVSPYLKWWPIITFLQTAFDLPMATSVPHGYGHNYAAASYIDAWIAVTEPEKWPSEATARLKRHFAEP